MATTSEATERAVHFVLQESQNRLKGEHLLQIIELSHQAEAIVHLSYDSWQVLIGVPERNCHSLEAQLSLMGYVRTQPDEMDVDVITFISSGNRSETNI